MTAQYIQLNQVLATMRSGEPFSLEWVACDIKRKTAGRWMRIKAAVLSATKAPKNQKANPAPTKTANHKEQDTINITNLKTRDITKVHVRLIKVFNGQTVVY